jgi:hypothetical protein
MRLDTIVAYTYQAETLCPACTMDALNVPQSLRDEQSHTSIVEMLAVAQGIDWQDERSFDSGDFPKVVFADSVESYVTGRDPFSGQEMWSSESCDSCGEDLL